MPFKQAMRRIGLRVPASGMATSLVKKPMNESRTGRISGDHPAVVYHGRDRRQHRVQPGRSSKRWSIGRLAMSPVGQVLIEAVGDRVERIRT